jgi:DNA-binding NarL/FixJ family response regulator
MNKQVSAELGVSEITVKVHRGNVMKKMGALADLVRMADAVGIRQAMPYLITALSEQLAGGRA